MKKSILSLLVLFGLSGCSAVRAPFVPPTAPISVVQAPLDLEVKSTKTGLKQGSSSVFTTLGLISVGNASYEAAARDAGISVIKNSDYSYFNLFYLFQKTTVNVYGD